MGETGAPPATTTALERARIRDEHARSRLGLEPRHGDVDINGDLVDTLLTAIPRAGRHGEPPAPLRVMCAWCGKLISEGETDEDGNASHGICADCAGKLEPGAAELARPCNKASSTPRAARLAACITGVDERMERMHLACLLKALERVPSR